ncbi:MAG: radical SAM protein [Planctomycetota bacterium]|jgi:radical SAM protein with 4Fe4S-binding SPASM domain
MERETTDDRGKPSYRPDGVLQLHVTERCNLRCAHCYQDNAPNDELPLRDLLAIVEQFKELLELWRQEAMGLPVRGQVRVTGGEPFVRPDFMDLLEALSADGEQVTFAILTNGTLVDAAVARRLAELAPAFVQISIDGARGTHDGIRGPGCFDRAESAVRHLVKAGVRASISFTAHRGNFREFAEVARLGCALGVSHVWADRLVPLGGGSALSEQLLTPTEAREFFGIMLQARIEAACSAFGDTEIAMHRSLQFLVAGERPYRCRAGDSLITVMPNGDVYPCRRMPIPVGNLMQTPLTELYYGSDLLRVLRDPQRVSDGCDGCRYAGACRGGARCISYAMTGSPFAADPGCWLADGRRQRDRGGVAAGGPDADG